MKKFVFLLLAALSLLALSGCAKIHEDMVISADGSVTARYEVVANEALYNDLMQAQQGLKADQMEPAAEGQMKGFTATYQIDNVKNLPKRLNEFVKIDDKTYRVDAQSTFFYDRYALAFSPSVGNKYMNQGGKKKPSGEKGPDDPDYTFTLHLPAAPEETNADDVSADGCTLTWDFTENLFTPGKAGHATFRVWNRTHIALVGILIVLLLAGAAVSMLRYRKAPTNQWKAIFAVCLAAAVAVAGWTAYTLRQPPEAKAPAQPQQEQAQDNEPGAAEKLADQAKSLVTGEPTITKLDSKTVGGAISTTTVTTEEETSDIGTRKTPVVHLGDKSAEQKINADIQQAISAIQPKLDDPYLACDKRSFDVKCDTADTLSLVICELSYDKGANGNHNRYVTLTYDKKTGARKPLGDYSGITAQEVLEKARTQLVSYHDGKQIKQQGNTPKLEQFFVTQDGQVWLLFQPYEMSYGAAGATCIQVQ